MLSFSELVTFITLLVSLSLLFETDPNPEKENLCDFACRPGKSESHVPFICESTSLRVSGKGCTLLTKMFTKRGLITISHKGYGKITVPLKIFCFGVYTEEFGFICI